MWSAMVPPFLRAYNERDWEALRALLATDFQLVDHRLTGWGTLDADGHVQFLRTMVDLVPDQQTRVIAVPRANQHGGVAVTRGGGVDRNGAEVEFLMVSLALRRDRLQSRHEIFAVEDLDRAVERFDELTAGQPALENACTRVAERIDAALLRGDVEDILACRSENSVEDDRRPGIRHEIADAAVRDGWRMVTEFCAGHGRRRTTLAKRGDRFALHAVTLQGTVGAAGDAEVSFLLVDEIDATGRIAHETLFESGDLAAAVARLDEAYLAQLSADDAAVWQAMCTMTDCYNRRDRQGLRSVFADDCVIVDERLTGWGTLGRDAFIGHLDDLLGMAPDTVLMPVVVHTVSNAGAVARFRTSGTVPDGGDFEMLFEATSLVRDGRVVRLELLPEDRTEEALRRLSPASTDGPVPE
jgi:ketosteroid isomerase-like protein